MRFIWRRALPVALLLLVAGLLSGCSPTPAGIPPITLEHARQLENTEPDKALAEFAAVRSQSDSTHPDVAAQALLESIEFSSDPSRFGTAAQVRAVDPANPGPGALKAMQDMRQRGNQSALDNLKQLFQHYPDSAAAAQARSIHLQQKVDAAVEATASKSLSYKIVDALVRLTGSEPGFSYWFALLLIAIFIRTITIPLMIKTYKSQREMQKMQPIIKELQQKYKDDQMELYRQTQAAYKEHGVNPWASCLPSLVQLPIFWWMFYVIRIYEVHFSHGFFLWIGGPLSHKYPDYIAGNLAQTDLPVLLMYALSMYLTTKMAPPPDPSMAQQQKSMSVIMTLFSAYYFWMFRWSTAFMLYYLFQNLISAGQQYFFIYRPRRLEMLALAAAPAAPTAPALPEPPASPAPDAQRAERRAPASRALARTPATTPVPGWAEMKPRPKRKGGRGKR